MIEFVLRYNFIFYFIIFMLFDTECLSDENKALADSSQCKLVSQRMEDLISDNELKTNIESSNICKLLVDGVQCQLYYNVSRLLHNKLDPLKHCRADVIMNVWSISSYLSKKDIAFLKQYSNKDESYKLSSDNNAKILCSKIELSISEGDFDSAKNFAKLFESQYRFDAFSSNDTLNSTSTYLCPSSIIVWHKNNDAERVADSCQSLRGIHLKKQSVNTWTFRSRDKDKLDPDLNSLVNVARANLLCKDTDTAWNAIRVALIDNPSSPWLRLIAGHILLVKGDSVSALESYKLAFYELKKHPDSSSWMYRDSYFWLENKLPYIYNELSQSKNKYLIKCVSSIMHRFSFYYNTDDKNTAVSELDNSCKMLSIEEKLLVDSLL